MSNKKFSELDLLGTAKGNAYIPVIDPDEALPENRAKRIMISTLTVGGADNTNFAPYDPNKYYSAAAPDYVSYNGNIYVAVNATPAKGKTPNPSPTHANAAYWRLTSAGQVSHVQNTDTHTNSSTFEIGKVTGQLLDSEGNPVIAPSGNSILIFGGSDDWKVAIRYVWETVGMEVTRKLQFSLNYAGGTLPVWSDFGSGGSTNAADIDYTPADTGFFGSALLKVKAALDVLAAKVKEKLNKSEFAYSALSLNPDAQTTINCNSQIIVSRTATISAASNVGNGYTVGFSNPVTGTTATLLFINSHIAVVNIVINPAANYIVYGNGSVKTLPVAVGKRLMVGATFDGTNWHITKVAE